MSDSSLQFAVGVAYVAAILLGAAALTWVLGGDFENYLLGILTSLFCMQRAELFVKQVRR